MLRIKGRCGVMDKLDELIIREFYMNEKTELGRMTIRALCDVLGVDLE